MNKYCLILAVLCSAMIIQGVESSTKLRAKKGYSPTDYKVSIDVIPGTAARDVGVGADGTIWHIGTQEESLGYALYRQKPGTTGWERIAGQGGVRVSVDPEGNAWVVTKDNKIYKYTGSSWQQIGGTAYDISCAPDGNVYHIGRNNNEIYLLNQDGKTWRKLNGGAVCVAGGPCRDAWHLNSNKEIYRNYPGSWERVDGQGTDIAVGANGQTWLLNNNNVPNQFSTWDEKRQSWVDVPVSEYLAKSGKAGSWGTSPTIRIAVTPNGDMIGVKQDMTLFRVSFKYA